ncbi:MAG: RNA-directed DNA polymerase, partial [SAR324 cluster bacterium]|nr:RNA-directed DNA polymerase [SAR324 cluster bacterium]
DGVAPSFRNGNPLEDARPTTEAVHPLGLRRWPCISNILPTPERLNQARSPEIDLKLHFYSFPDRNQLAEAAGESAKNGITPRQIALAIGLSPRIFRFFTRKPAQNYRSFEIRKRDGSERHIDAPRLFLKITQRWLADYVFSSLPAHPACHSYKAGRSFITNAVPHCNKKYILNADIKDFFGSISTEDISRCLVNLGISYDAISLISRLTTLNNRLPQGAPSSPVLSNAVLFEFDEEMDRISSDEGFSYTRYSDDITISGENKKKLESIQKVLEKKLKDRGLYINNEKIKVLSASARQMVTGVVVNSVPNPPRNLRRRIRAMLHNADKNPNKYKKKYLELNGYVSFLNAFESLRGGTEISRYRKILNKIKKHGN